MNYYIKTDRGSDAEPLDEKTARNILKRLRHEGRKLVEIYVVGTDGSIDRYQERIRRRLGSNAIASRTWLCETLDSDEWTNGRYIPDPQESVEEMDPEPEAVMLVLQGADAPELIVRQLQGLPAPS